MRELNMTADCISKKNPPGRSLSLQATTHLRFIPFHIISTATSLLLWQQDVHSLNMKTTAFCALLAATATAAPVITERSGITDNELTDGSCKKITFIMARGSTEIGNMVC